MTDYQLKNSHSLNDSRKDPRTAPAEVPISPARNYASVKQKTLSSFSFIQRKNSLWFYLQGPQTVREKELWHSSQSEEENEVTWWLKVTTA